MSINFDKYSMLINNERLVVKSAALHYFRNPGENAWRDRLGKLKACGYNTVDLYFYWGYHSKQPGVYVFTGIKDIRALLDITIELGLHVIARSGPYINAELSAGGFPYWLFNVPDVIIRNKKDGNFVYSDSYMKAVKEWYSRILPIINEYDNVLAMQIENEYSTNAAEPNYIQNLYDLARSLGIKVPIFHNDAFYACLYSDIVNIYAADIYPTINFNSDWKENKYSFGSLDFVEENFRECSPDSPLFIAELQSGWLDKWNGKGYDFIREQLGRDHINIVTKTALSQGITMFNHYMGCGGTSWGQLACSEIYTSYDFAAPISEYGIPQDNYYKAKETNYFLNAFNLSSTDMIGENKDILSPELAENDNFFVRLRQDNINNCRWLFVRNLDNKAHKLRISDKFDVYLKSFDMKILPLELDLYGCKIDFSSLSIFGKIEKDNYQIIFLLVDKNSELIVSDFENKEIPEYFEREELDKILKIKINQDIPDLSGCKFFRDDKVTEFIFLKQETSDKTWLLKDKAVIGPDFLSDNLSKAAFIQDSQLKILDLVTDPEWKTEKITLNKKLDNLIKIDNWNYFKCAPEIDYGYDFSNWNFIEDPGKFDCISNKIYDEFIWYKGSFQGIIEQIEISAKHCFAIYINGYQVYYHDSLHYDYGKELSEDITINLENKFFRKNEINEITVLVQNLGFDKGFENDVNLPRGILSFKAKPEIEWRMRGASTPEIEEWDFVSIENLENSSKNEYLLWATANFEAKLSEDAFCPMYLEVDNPAFDKANIYLNGNIIGRYWKGKSPQTKFYLMDGFIEENNRISLIIWNTNEKIEDYNFQSDNVNIKIGIIGYYSLIDLKGRIS